MIHQYKETVTQRQSHKFTPQITSRGVMKIAILLRHMPQVIIIEARPMARICYIILDLCTLLLYGDLFVALQRGLTPAQPGLPSEVRI